MHKIETMIEENKVIYRGIIEAPIELVFEAWSTEEHLAECWGPDGFTLTTKKFDFKEGGTWEFTMHGNDGTDYQNKMKFTEIKKPHIITHIHGGEGEHSHISFESKISFQEKGEETIFVMEQIFKNKEVLESINEKYGVIEGGKQHINNCANYIKSLLKENTK
jgi:uncharacterized protein YndB with AHSA1/START domain